MGREQAAEVCGENGGLLRAGKTRRRQSDEHQKDPQVERREGLFHCDLVVDRGRESNAASARDSTEVERHKSDSRQNRNCLHHGG